MLQREELTQRKEIITRTTERRSGCAPDVSQLECVLCTADIYFAFISNFCTRVSKRTKYFFLFLRQGQNNDKKFFAPEENNAFLNWNSCFLLCPERFISPTSLRIKEMNVKPSKNIPNRLMNYYAKLDEYKSKTQTHSAVRCVATRSHL